MNEVRSLIGYMPENDSFIANMNAVSFVRMLGELSGLPPDAALERAHEVLFYVGLGEARYRLLGTYSLGMKQLAKLAQAIIHGPRLVILDEPTNGLDPPGSGGRGPGVAPLELPPRHLGGHLPESHGGLNVAVYKRSYKTYSGRLTPAWSRFLVLPRFSWARLFQSKYLMMYLVACFFY